MRIKWSFSLFDKHLYKIFKVKILHSNKDGICGVCMLQMSGYRGVGKGSRLMPNIYIVTSDFIGE
jgi:hypothetical protein